MNLEVIVRSNAGSWLEIHLKSKIQKGVQNDVIKLWGRKEFTEGELPRMENHLQMLTDATERQTIPNR
ncbi:hypothetical protein ABE44_12100 [Bacillus thuringiensis]|nr:hypothetical protein [Bacillus thuringiensis]